MMTQLVCLFARDSKPLECALIGPTEYLQHFWRFEPSVFDWVRIGEETTDCSSQIEVKECIEWIHQNADDKKMLVFVCDAKSADDDRVKMLLRSTEISHSGNPPRFLHEFHECVGVEDIVRVVEMVEGKTKREMMSETPPECKVGSHTENLENGGGGGRSGSGNKNTLRPMIAMFASAAVIAAWAKWWH
jgi:hypothetical protein